MKKDNKAIIVDEFFNTKLEEVSEYIEKFNRSKEDMEKANSKMVSYSISSSEEDKPETVKKGGVVLAKRTNKDYERLWNLFKENELQEFEQKMQYGEKEIKKIGIKKFIDAMDWYYNDDVKKWRTDILHIIPCVHCGREFAIYEQDLGLCQKCKPLYDLERFAQTCMANDQISPGISFGLRVSFVFNKEFRENYRIKSLKEQIKTAIDEKFSGMNSYMMLKTANDEGWLEELFEQLDKKRMNKNTKVFLDELKSKVSGCYKDKVNEILSEIYLK